MTKKVRKDGSEIDEDRRYIRWKSLEAVARFSWPLSCHIFGREYRHLS